MGLPKLALISLLKQNFDKKKNASTKVHISEADLGLLQHPRGSVKQPTWILEAG